ncbi:putative peptidase S10, serine carboxypeptidase, alpha/Beta hydrolase [Helianthus annuus]|nr:putative peptidase S10, serine carboxypeptidase, alpha/Beta hydrolase [Helianthus annuus]
MMCVDVKVIVDIRWFANWAQLWGSHEQDYCGCTLLLAFVISFFFDALRVDFNSSGISKNKIKMNVWMQWLLDHPKFFNNPLYLGGDSYTGIVLPMLVQEIFNGIEVGEWPQINIEGYMLGNPLTDLTNDYNSRIPFAHRMALLSDEIYKSVKENCHGDYLNVDPNNIMCIHDLQVYLKRIKGVHILEPACPRSDSLEVDPFITGVRAIDKTSMDILPQVQNQSCRD